VTLTCAACGAATTTRFCSACGADSRLQAAVRTATRDERVRTGGTIAVAIVAGIAAFALPYAGWLVAVGAIVALMLAYRPR
jgi:hypothetical protein